MQIKYGKSFNQLLEIYYHMVHAEVFRSPLQSAINFKPYKWFSGDYFRRLRIQFKVLFLSFSHQCKRKGPTPISKLQRLCSHPEEDPAVFPHLTIYLQLLGSVGVRIIAIQVLLEYNQQINHRGSLKPTGGVELTQ